MDSVKPSAVERMKPMLHLSEDDLPEIKDWKVGGKYTIVLEVEQTGAHKNMAMLEGDSKKMSADFTVLNVSVGDRDEEEEDEDYEETSEGEKPVKVAQALRRKLNS